MQNDHNLLFAAIAFRDGFVRLDQYTQACQACLAHRELTIAEYFLTRKLIDDEQLRQIEAAVNVELNRHDGNALATLGAIIDEKSRTILHTSNDDAVRSAVAAAETIVHQPGPFDDIQPAAAMTIGRAESALSNPVEPNPADARILAETIQPDGDVRSSEPYRLLHSISDPSDSRSRYTRTRVHGEGGLGRVWLARDGDLNREVALKELKPQFASNRDATRRMLKEAQVTGQLEHPNIVPVYELATRDGDEQPYYTMRFVRGQTLRDEIARYHVKRRAKLLDPLELPRLLGAFVCVCNAIAYAHSRGVLHRDLKPENVALGSFGEVVVLDWGLAKVVGEPELHLPAVSLSEAADGVATIDGHVIGTPAYMAPEQAKGRNDEVDERTDVYGLGTILFELLAGRPPFQGINTAETLRSVVNGAVPHPRLILPTVPGPLDAVCAKALAKNPIDRYRTATELGQEVQRFLADEPVDAFPDPLAVKMSRWVKRNRTIVSSVTVLLVTAVIGLTVATLLLNHANRATARQRDRANDALVEWQRQHDRAEKALAGSQQHQKQLEESLVKTREAEARANESAITTAAVNQFLVRDMLGAAAPEKALGRKITVEEVLNAASRKVELSLASQPRIAAAVRTTIGSAYRQLGVYDAAEPHLVAVLELHQRLKGDQHQETIAALNNLSALRKDQGKFADAEALARRALAAQIELVGSNNLATLTIMSNLAELLRLQGKSEAAEPLARKVVETKERFLGPDSTETLAAVNNLALIVEAQGRPAEAESLARNTLDAQRRVQGLDHPATLTSISNLAAFLHRHGKTAEAESLMRDVLAEQRRVLGVDHAGTLATMNNFAELLRMLNRLDEAESVARDAYERQCRTQPAEHPNRLSAMTTLALVLHKAHKVDEAESLLRDALRLQKSTLGDRHPTTLKTLFNLAVLSAGKGANDEAESLYGELLSAQRLMRSPLGEVASTLASLGKLLVDSGKPDRAEPHLREALELRIRLLPRGHWQIANVQSLLGAALTELGRFENARPLLLDGYAVLENAAAATPDQKKEAIARIVRMYEKTSQPLKAAEWRAKQPQDP